jgi:hypothetical protein
MKLQEFLKQTETPWDKFTAPFYSIRRFAQDLYYNLPPRKLKYLFQMLKMWWGYNDFDYAHGLILLKWHTDNLIQTYETYSNDHTGQKKNLKQMKILSEILKRQIENDYGYDKLARVRMLESGEMLGKYMRYYRKFWI